MVGVGRPGEAMADGNQRPLDDVEAAVIRDFVSGKTYEEVAEAHGKTVSWVYRLTLRCGVRRHEAKIQMRATERKRFQEAFLRSVIGTTVTSDVLDFLSSIPSKSVAMHFNSPPFNQDKPYGGIGGDSLSFHAYLGWQLMCLAEQARTLQEGGVLFVQVGRTYAAEGHAPWPLDAVLFGHLVSMGLTFQSRVVWVVPHGLTPKKRLAERHMTALVFSRGPIKTFNATPGRTPTKQPGKRAYRGPNKGAISSHGLGSFPSDVWPMRNVASSHAERTDHCCQFPVAFARRAILMYSMPGDLVVDCFSGSGTTEETCARTGRDFAGCDLFYADTREKRLAKVAPDLVSLLPGVTDESIAVWQAEAKPVWKPNAVHKETLRAEWRELELDLAFAEGHGE